jgi:Zn finger protein HypA/HybF involved in hydrogenase expression
MKIDMYRLEQVVDEIMEGNLVVLKKFELEDVKEQIWCLYGIGLVVKEINDREVRVQKEG